MNDTIGYEDDDAIDRYLNGKMAESERTAFEIRVMEDPALFERVQLLAAFARGLGRESAALNQSQSAQVIRFPLWLRESLLMAASVLVTVAAMHLYQGGPATGDTSATTAGIMPVGTMVILEQTRDDAPGSFTGTGPYLLQLDAGLDTTAKAFTVTLRSTGNNAVVLQQRNLPSDGKGWVRLLTNQELAGDYTAELAWTDADGTARSNSYRFSIGR